MVVISHPPNRPGGTLPDPTPFDLKGTLAW